MSQYQEPTRCDDGAPTGLEIIPVTGFYKDITPTAFEMCTSWIGNVKRPNHFYFSMSRMS
jgi:hypothetical protein